MKSQMQKDADSSQGCKSLPNLGPAGQTGFSDSGVSSQLSDTELTAIATLEREVCLPLAGHSFLMVTNWLYMVSRPSVSSHFSLQWSLGMHNSRCLLLAQAFIFLAAKCCLHCTTSACLAILLALGCLQPVFNFYTPSVAATQPAPSIQNGMMQTFPGAKICICLH